MTTLNLCGTLSVVTLAPVVKGIFASLVPTVRSPVSKQHDSDDNWSSRNTHLAFRQSTIALLVWSFYQNIDVQNPRAKCDVQAVVSGWLSLTRVLHVLFLFLCITWLEAAFHR